MDRASIEALQDNQFVSVGEYGGGPKVYVADTFLRTWNYGTDTEILDTVGSCIGYADRVVVVIHYEGDEKEDYNVYIMSESPPNKFSRLSDERS